MGFSQSLQEKLSLVEADHKQYTNQFKPLQIYDQYVNKDPIARLREQDLEAVQILIRMTKADRIVLICQARTQEIRSYSLIQAEEYCADGVQYSRRIA